MEKFCEECQRFYQYFVREKKKTSEIRLKLAKKIQEKNVKLRFNDCFFLTKKKKKTSEIRFKLAKKIQKKGVSN